uniref:Uncharacterized protein n=1 Tax=Triticum urartu TaxID=4572 RepID=A0A8R7PFK9_TRIUA
RRPPCRCLCSGSAPLPPPLSSLSRCAAQVKVAELTLFFAWFLPAAGAHQVAGHDRALQGRRQDLLHRRGTPPHLTSSRLPHVPSTAFSASPSWNSLAYGEVVVVCV